MPPLDQDGRYHLMGSLLSIRAQGDTKVSLPGIGERGESVLGGHPQARRRSAPLGLVCSHQTQPLGQKKLTSLPTSLSGACRTLHSVQLPSKIYLYRRFFCKLRQGSNGLTASEEKRKQVHHRQGGSPGGRLFCFDARRLFAPPTPGGGEWC